VTFSEKTLSLLVLIALGLGALALLFAALNQGRRRNEPRGPIQMDESSLACSRAGALDPRLEAAVRAKLHRQRSAGLIEGSVAASGSWYDAFEDVGGRLSFSCAFLDDHGSGVVVTSINGRQDTRVYAKPLIEGKSPYNLSIEEEEAIRQASAGPREAVKAR
jgi:hypothetical protein